MFNKREILNELIQVFKKNLSNLDSVLLAGSFSRNEESFLQISSNLIVPLSDIEFIIFQNTKDYFLGGKLQKLSSQLGELSIKFGIKIDFSIKPKISLYLTPNTFFWYETFLTGRIVFGALKLPNIKHVNQGDVYEILNHSIISLLLKQQHDNDNFVKYQILKASLDLLIPLLYCGNKTIATHTLRYKTFLKMCDQLNLSKDVLKLLEHSYNVKCKQVIISNVFLSSLDQEFLIKNYLIFSRCIFELVNSKKCKMGDTSMMRKIHQLKLSIKYRDNKFLNKKRMLCNVYELNYSYLSGDDNELIKDFFAIGKIDFKNTMHINKLIYRYL
jgi:hypothetical protein